MHLSVGAAGLTPFPLSSGLQSCRGGSIGQMPDGKLETVEGKKFGELNRKCPEKQEKLFLQLVTFASKESSEYSEQLWD